MATNTGAPSAKAATMHKTPGQRNACGWLGAELEEQRAARCTAPSETARSLPARADALGEPDEAHADEREGDRHDDAAPPLGDAAGQRVRRDRVVLERDVAGVGEHHRRHRRDGAAEVAGDATERVIVAQERRRGQAEVLAGGGGAERADEAEPHRQVLHDRAEPGALAADLAQQDLERRG